MAAPTSTNEVTARRLSSVISQLWAKIKDTFYKKPSEGIPATDLSSDCQNAVSNAKDYFTIDYESTTYSFSEILAKIASGYVVRVAFIPPESTLKYFIPFSNVALFDESGTPTNIWFSTAASPVLVNNNEQSYIWVCISKKQDGSCEWTADDEYFKVDWTGVKNTPTEYNPSAHTHSASDIKSGTLPDARIASASTWNNKMDSSGSNATADGIGNIIRKAPYYTASDFPTDLGDPQIGVLFRDSSGNVNSSGRINLENFESLLKSDIGAWPSTKELYQSDRGNVWFMSCSKTQVYRLTMPSNKDCGLAGLFVHTTATNGWPLIFQVGWRWGGSSFSVVPHLAYIYTTSQSSEDKIATVKYSGSCLYICINQTQTQRRALFSLISDNVDSVGFDIISQTSSEYVQATSVAAGNTEGCVMKEAMGTKIGDYNRPVYVTEAGFVSPCNFYFS